MERQLAIEKHGSYEILTAILKTLIGPMAGKSLIDLCCNEAPVTSKLPFAKKWYLDVEYRTLSADQEHFVQADVLGDHPLLREHYDVALCLDGIEHLTRDQGWILVERMKWLADLKIIFTPLDPWMMEAEGSDRYLHDPKCHKSVWSPNDLPDWAHIVMPIYHPTLKIGAFFSWSCPDIDGHFVTVCQTISKWDLRKFPD